MVIYAVDDVQDDHAELTQVRESIRFRVREPVASCGSVPSRCAVSTRLLQIIRTMSS